MFLNKILICLLNFHKTKKATFCNLFEVRATIKVNAS